jgi:hypothetical protein
VALVSLLVIANALFSIGFAGNDRPDVVGFEEGAECIGVVAFVGEELADAGDKADAVRITQSAALPGVRTKTQGRQKSSTTA